MAVISELVNKLEAFAWDDDHKFAQKASALLEQAIAAAVAEEREACAKLARSFADSYHGQMEGMGEPEFGQLNFAMAAATKIAQFIRARKSK